MAQTPKKSQQPAPRPPLTRRARSRHERERRRQRLVIIVSSSAVILALLAIGIGLGYDQLWVPSRPVAQLSSATLSRRDYWTERRYEIARRMTQNLQSLALIGSFSPQFSEQLAGQITTLNDQIPQLRSGPVDDETVNGWIDRQLIIDGAAKRNLQADKGEIAQQLVSDLASAFPPPAPPPTTTATLTPTTALTGTTTLTQTTAPATGGTAAVTSGTPAAATPTGPAATPSITPTLQPTETPGPTNTPTATPLPDAAQQQQDEIIGRLFDVYNGQLLNTQGRSNLELDDFRAALYDQYLRQVLTNKIEAQLLPESEFTPSTDPSSIETRHILIAVTVPVTATDTEREAAYARRKPDAEAILAQLGGGADFATLAQEKSDDATTKAQGGTLPAFDKDGKTQEGSAFDPAFVKAALALKEGETSKLVRTPFGWHIIQVTKRTVESKEDQLKAARSKKFDEWLAEQRAAANVQHFPPQTPTATTAPTPISTAAPLPTVPLGGEPTAVPTTTATLTSTIPLTSTTTSTTALPTAATPQATSTAPAGTPAPVPSNAAPSAVLPSPIGTPKP